MDIEVGNFVRTKEGIIRQIEQIGVSLYWLEDGSSFNIKKNSNKYSKNITDLIEKDDYVNGYKVIEVTNHTFTTLEHGGNKVHHKECITIKSVLTKEQFKNIEYRLE